MKIVVLLVAAALFVSGCQSDEPALQSVDQVIKSSVQQTTQQSVQPTNQLMIYTLQYDEDTSNPVETIQLTITNKDLIAVFTEAFNGAVPRPGIMDMTLPTIKVKLGAADYYLFINEQKRGSLVNVEDSHTLYTLSESATIKIREILSWSEPVEPIHGLVVDKKIMTDNQSHQILVVTNRTENDDQNRTMNEIIDKANQDRQLAWYVVDKEVFEQLEKGQGVEIISANKQLDSLPPIRTSITVRLKDSLSNKRDLRLSRIENELATQQLVLTTIDVEKDWILDGVEPSRYTVDTVKAEDDSSRHEQVSIYIFDSDLQLEAGLKDFHEQTELMNMVYPRIYKIKNVMIFYWAHGNRNESSKFGTQFEKAAAALLLY